MNARPPQPPKTLTNRNSFYNIFIGVDPGSEGGVAVINARGELSAFQIPETDIELRTKLGCDVEPEDSTFVCVEQVASSPQMGVTSAFTFGKNFGRISYAVFASGYSHTFVRPQVWQKALGVPPRNKDKETQPQFKDRLVKVAQRLFPKFYLWNEPRSLGRQRAVADAILIAQYCRLNHG